MSDLHITGTFVTGVGADADGPYYEVAEKTIVVSLLNDTTPIGEACDALRFDKDTRLAVISLVGVRTLGDLRVVLERGEVEKGLAAKIEKAVKGL